MNLDIYNRTKEIQSHEFDEILSTLSNFEKINFNVGKSAISGRHGIFYFTDSERSLNVSYLPIKSGDIVDMSEPKLVESDVVVVYPDTKSAWFIPEDKISELNYFPKLRQAFHENKPIDKPTADYKYHFPDGDEIVSIFSPNPVRRLDEPIIITALEFIGGKFPQVWLLETESNGFYYLRERSGSIRLLDDFDLDCNTVFQAFIGREHPGTILEPHEVINIVSSVDYIKFKDDYSDKVSEEAHEEYWGDMINNTSYDDMV